MDRPPRIPRPSRSQSRHAPQPRPPTQPRTSSSQPRRPNSLPLGGNNLPDPLPRRPSHVNPLHFPEPVMIEAQNPCLQNQAADAVYIRSATKGLLPLIRNLKCANCNQRFSTENLPYTGPCGHFFCSNHSALKLSRLVPAGLAWSYRYCKTCRGNARISYNGLDTCPPNGLLLELYEALETRERPVFKCVDCGNFHPENNSVCCIKCPDRRRNGVDDPSVCVWCAVKKHKNHRLRNVSYLDQNKSYGGDDKLESLDCKYFRLFSALVQCATCTQFFTGGVKLHKNVVQMPCGRMVDDDCLDHEPESVPCNFCEADHTHIIKGEREAKHIHEVAQEMGGHFECHGRDNCGKHPNDNGELQEDGTTTFCVWCTLVKRDKQQRLQRV